ncbi:MAG: hypothetical protein H5T69_02390 [Chloroflexi bacterium]|nr:hypothetical protein [Chloroflexota bacterium]
MGWSKRRSIGWGYAARTLGLVLAALAIAWLAAGVPAWAEPDPQIHVHTAKPAVYLDPASKNVPVGFETMVTVRVDNVSKLLGVNYRLNFDPSVLQVVDADPLLPGTQIYPAEIFQGMTTSTAANSVDNTAGTIEYGVLLLTLSPGDQPVTGSGALGRIKFRVVGYGSSPVQFADIDEWTKLIVEWPGGIPQPAPATWTDGVLTGVSGYKLRLPLVYNSR